MQLSSEDSLRLNVLLRQTLKAVRIDDSRMIVHALTDKGEARVPLNPTCREEPYLRLVRELFSTHVLGSPGGYPVYLRRWTRMGQARDGGSLEKLLLLGEPEAVVAVVHSPGLTHEVASRAWWAHPTAEIARQLLKSAHVIAGELGGEVAEFLVEYLPFESEHQAMIDSVRLVLQPGLIDTAQREALWSRARRKQSYYIGFLYTLPDELPDQHPAHPEWEESGRRLETLARDDNPPARLLLKTLSPAGQVFLKTAAHVLRKIPNQDAAVELMEAISACFSELRPDEAQYRSMDDIFTRADQAVDETTGTREFRAILSSTPEYRDLLRAIVSLSMLSEYTVAPIFGHSNAIGTVMRRRLEPVTQPVLKLFAMLNPAIRA